MKTSTKTFGKKSSSIALFVGGSGDTKDTHDKFIIELNRYLPFYEYMTFSFSGREEGKECGLAQQAIEFKELLDVISKEKKDILIIATSMGAYCVVKALEKIKKSWPISQVIFIDPADYYLKDEKLPVEPQTWPGIEIYDPDAPTVSSLLSKLPSGAIIHVLNFTIRNYDQNGYSPIDERGVDNPEKFSRLNNEMVQSFYNHTPENNKGVYLETNLIPHAFIRDGNVNKNIETLVKTIKRILYR